MTRKTALRGLVVLPALAAFVAAGTVADAKGSKAQFKYQPKPNGAQQCSKCAYFTPSASDGASGTCAVVAGTIGSNGWCTAYSAKS